MNSCEHGCIHGGIIGGQGPKTGLHSLGHYWGPGTERWGPFIGALFVARGKKVGSIHRGIRDWSFNIGRGGGGSLHGVIIGGQGLKCGVPSWGHYWGPGSEKWGPFMWSFIGTQGPKSGVPS